MTDATGVPDPEWGKEIDEEEPRIIHIQTASGAFAEILATPFLRPPPPTPEEQQEAAMHYLKARYGAEVTGEVYREPERWMLGAAAQGYPEQEPADLEGYPEGEREE